MGAIAAGLAVAVLVPGLTLLGLEALVEVLRGIGQ
jgi:hypothetical protein